MTGPKARECGTKQQHPTQAEALAHWSALVRGGSSRKRLTVYRCRHCRAWHVGHKPKPRRTR